MSGTTQDAKREVGRHAAGLVTDGMALGLGTGSTADHFLDALGERVAQGLRVRGVPTSERTARRARSLGIGLVTLDECPELDLAIDGADQVDPRGDLIKGLGGALLREKRVARAARAFVVIVDASKRVPTLGVGCPVPVEIDPARHEAVDAALRDLGARPVRRDDAAGHAYVTDNGGWILDAHFGAVRDAGALEERINALPGVRDNGLFVGMVSRVLVAGADGVEDWVPPIARRNAPGGNLERP